LRMRHLAMGSPLNTFSLLEVSLTANDFHAKIKQTNRTFHPKKAHVGFAGGEYLCMRGHFAYSEFARNNTEIWANDTTGYMYRGRTATHQGTLSFKP